MYEKIPVGGPGIVAVCNMRGIPHAVGQAMRSDLQADINGIQPVATRGCAGDVGHFAVCLVCNLDM